jgi:hypothetical protein
MNSSLIGKIEKARRYADERDSRISFEELSIRVNGDNSNHSVEYREGTFLCDCNFFPSWRTCSHVMAVERILDGMLPDVSKRPSVKDPAQPGLSL